MATAARGASSPSDAVRLGLIGLGWRGGQHLEALLARDDCAVVALCDPEARCLEAARKQAPRARACADMRELLDDRDIDAVVISTCNHWHCLAAVWACAAGKDVYVEKPLSYTLWEGRQLVNAARHHGRVVQVGTQQRSDPLPQAVRAFLHDERALGPIESVSVTRFGIREGIGKRDTPLEMPATLDYDLWLGPAADVPMYRSKVDYDWHWDWNTGNGESANWGVHVLDDVRNVAFRDAVSLPSAVTCGGGRVAWNDAAAQLCATLFDRPGYPAPRCTFRPAFTGPRADHHPRRWPRVHCIAWFWTQPATGQAIYGQPPTLHLSGRAPARQDGARVWRVESR